MRWRRVGIAAAVLVVIGMLGGVGWIASAKDNGAISTLEYDAAKAKLLERGS